jgi:exopolysaccharide production protein ExoQ
MSQRHEVLLGAAVVVGFLSLMEPQQLWGRYSILEAALVVLALSLLGSRHTPQRAPVPVVVPLVALLVLMGASSIWSFASWESLRDTVSYGVLAVCAWLIVRSARLQTVVIAIALAGTLVLAASTALLLLNPPAALYYDTSGFQGIYGNRNTLAFVMTLTLPAALAMNVRGLPSKLGKFVLVAAFLIAIGFTLSRSSWIVAALVVLTWVGLAILRRNRWLGATFFGLIGAGGLVGVANFSSVLALFDKSDTINGRTGIWAGVLDAVKQNPLMGYGWSRSWPPGSPHSERVSQELAAGHVVFHAHNEILNWLVTTGVLGAVLIITLYAFAIFGGALTWWRRDEAAAVWLPLAAVALVARGFSDISETNAQGWFAFMLLLAAVANTLPPSSRIARSRFLLLRPRLADPERHSGSSRQLGPSAEADSSSSE